jgi:hypothetical protein
VDSNPSKILNVKTKAAIPNPKPRIDKIAAKVVKLPF